MRAATVVQQLCKSCRTCFMLYCMFYFTCDRSLNGIDSQLNMRSIKSLNLCDVSTPRCASSSNSIQNPDCRQMNDNRSWPRGCRHLTQLDKRWRAAETATSTATEPGRADSFAASY